MSVILQADWEAKGRELFGPDQEKWAFKCPACGNAMSLEKARAAFPELAGCGWSPGQECLGRHTARIVDSDGARCNWAAYGLFRGPVIVKRADGTETAAFEFAQPAEAQRAG